MQSRSCCWPSGCSSTCCSCPIAEAAEQTILQKVVPYERQGRVFGFAQSVEQAASPLTAFLIGPIAQFVFIPFMTNGSGAHSIGGWFGTGADRGLALVFMLTGSVGMVATVLALRSRPYRRLSRSFAGLRRRGRRPACPRPSSTRAEGPDHRSVPFTRSGGTVRKSPPSYAGAPMGVAIAARPVPRRPRRRRREPRT